MIKYLLQGFMLGLAYVAPIGMQNLYVINTAIDKSKLRAYQVALTTIFFDISLALACFFGVGALMEKLPILKLGVLLVGSIAVLYIGIQLIISKVDNHEKVDVNKSMIQVILTCFLITWANPQALIDGSLLLGGVKASLTPEAGSIFIIGVCIASMSWFLGLTTMVSIFKNSFNEKVIKIINVVCGVIIIYYGLKLGYSFVQAII
ncbi:LysE/ArgO family amino acid transporter [Oceanirhabdus seepicola]|uniref:LysE family transporter n=1 Tax=Oceanirhabdus seepicola TaxID=2828781 RepID=A0A9J6P632_9CLOT|nr:LysE family transporter [Oceanirhabdus seepicola]MCM1992183.1 LysE family transporter [Oceanirhabdus seepicola]